jgi:N-methylhydantoinase B
MVALKAGDIVEMVCGNGGGWGDPKKRDRELIRKDIKNGLVTREKAKAIYGYEE